MSEDTHADANRQAESENNSKKSNLDFLDWTELENDSILVKRVYVDIAGSLSAGAILSQIIYWHTFSKKGKSRLGVYRDGRYWLVKKYSEWWDECRVRPRTARRDLQRLKGLGVIDVRSKKFGKTPQCHIYLNTERTAELIKLTIEGARSGQNGQVEVAKMDTSFNTETTLTETCINANGPSPQKPAKRLSHVDIVPFDPFQKNMERVQKAVKELSADPATGDFKKRELAEIPDMMNFYFEAYRQFRNAEHPIVKQEAWTEIIGRICDNMTVGFYEPMILQYFTDENLACDYNIHHFSQPGILWHRAFDIEKSDEVWAL